MRTVACCRPGATGRRQPIRRGSSAEERRRGEGEQRLAVAEHVGVVALPTDRLPARVEPFGQRRHRPREAVARGRAAVRRRRAVRDREGERGPDDDGDRPTIASVAEGALGRARRLRLSAAASRSATTAPKSRRRSGEACMTDSKSAFDSESALMSVAAVTVAVRGRSARIAISPTNLRGRSWRALALGVRGAGDAVDDQVEAIARVPCSMSVEPDLNDSFENFDESASTSSGRRCRKTRCTTFVTHAWPSASVFSPELDLLST